MLGNTGPQYVVLPHRAVPRRAASRRVASCREDRNGFYPRDAATRQRGTGLWGKAIYIVNLALLTIVDSLLAVSAFESRSAIAVVFKDTCVDAGCAVRTERLDGIDWMVAHTSCRGHTTYTLTVVLYRAIHLSMRSTTCGSKKCQLESVCQSIHKYRIGLLIATALDMQAEGKCTIILYNTKV